MRKFIGAALAAVAVVGVLGASAGVATAGPLTTQEAAEAKAATCVKAKKWYNEGSGRWVRVQNTCGYKVCFSVTVAAASDPEFSIGANKTQNFRYGGILWTEGTGLKRISC
ncbi:hypothetical protein ACQF36_06415 [Streptomyces sp. Marseille-Q5077]|uniref:hypothetical protein n=1 Tax=Streptomyces sp. Marseille-Q5077 TaxID=3418995 RepID=UPI003D08A88E